MIPEILSKNLRYSSQEIPKNITFENQKDLSSDTNVLLEEFAKYFIESASLVTWSKVEGFRDFYSTLD